MYAAYTPSDIAAGRPSSAADNQKDCAFNEESMALLPVLVHTIRFNFRCGGKLDLTCEDCERSMTLIHKKRHFSARN